MKKCVVFGAVLSVVLGGAGCQRGTGTGPGTSTEARPKKLTVMFKEAHSIEQGEEDRVLVTIDRDNFDDTVTVRIENLPEGVTAEPREVKIPPGENTTTFTLRAAKDAKPVVDHRATVVAEAPGVQTVKLPLKLTVRTK
jgi:hypothetical protein